MPLDAEHSLTPDIVTPNGNLPLALDDGNEETAHVLFLDIVGFTKLRPATKQRLVLGKLQEIVRSTDDFRLAQDSKELIALPTGDGMALVFLTRAGSGAATSCAEKIADAILKHNEATSDGDHIHVRMGIHSGNVVQIYDVNDRLNVAGEGINTAQRVMDCGDIGHILLSDHALHLLPGVPDRIPHCSSLGKVKVKHDQEVNLFSLSRDRIGNQETPQKIQKQTAESKRFETAMEEFRREEQKRRRIREAIGAAVVVSIIVIAGFFIWYNQAPTTPPSLAILSFQPQTPTKYSSRAISKGLSEDFRRNASLKIAISSPTLLEINKAVNQSAPNQTDESRREWALRIGKQLGVRWALTGTVESQEANLNKPEDLTPALYVIVNAELFNTDTGERWAHKYPPVLFDGLIALQDSIIKDVAQKIKADQIDEATKAGGGVADTDFKNYLNKKAQAHWYYLAGRFWSLQRTYAEGKERKDFTEKAVKSYQSATDIKIDPYYTLGLAGLADIHISNAGVGNDPKTASKEALDVMLKAMLDAIHAWQQRAKHDESSREEMNALAAEAYASIGTAKWWPERDFLGAMVTFQFAIKLDPQLGDVHKRYSSCLAALGENEAAQDEIDLALKLEPQSAIFQLTRGQNYIFAGNPKDAVEQLEAVIADNPDMSAAYRFLAMAFELQGRSDEALKQLEKFVKQEQDQKGKSDSRQDSDFLATEGHVLASLNRTEEALQKVREIERMKKESQGKADAGYISSYNIAVVYAGLPDKTGDALRWLATALDECDPRVTWLKVEPRFNAVRTSKPDEFNQLVRRWGLSCQRESGTDALRASN